MKRVAPTLLFYRCDGLGDGVVFSSISCHRVLAITGRACRLALWSSTLQIHIDIACCRTQSWVRWSARRQNLEGREMSGKAFKSISLYRPFNS